MLKTSRWILKVVNWLNWGIGVPVVLAGIALGWIATDQLLAILEAAGRRSPELMLHFVQVVFLLTAPMILLAHIILTRLIAIIDSIPAHETFSIVNAERLRQIAWALIGTQVIDLLAGLYMQYISELSGEYLGWSFGFTGWLAALMLFILARVFREGAGMREELAGTI
jgi:hypothetical protein